MYRCAAVRRRSWITWQLSPGHYLSGSTRILVGLHFPGVKMNEVHLGLEQPGAASADTSLNGSRIAEAKYLVDDVRLNLGVAAGSLASIVRMWTWLTIEINLSQVTSRVQICESTLVMMARTCLSTWMTTSLGWSRSGCRQCGGTPTHTTTGCAYR